MPPQQSKLGSNFKNKWLVKYGLQITARNAKMSNILSINPCKIGIDSSKKK
jgi:hypothetical protein